MIACVVRLRDAKLEFEESDVKFCWNDLLLVVWCEPWFFCDIGRKVSKRVSNLADEYHTVSMEWEKVGRSLFLTVISIPSSRRMPCFLGRNDDHSYWVLVGDPIFGDSVKWGLSNEHVLDDVSTIPGGVFESAEMIVN